MSLENKSIRKQAFSLYKKHWKPLAQIMVVCFLPSAAFMLISAALIPEKRFLSSIISFALNVLTFPAVMLGSSHTLLRTWRGDNPRFSMIFRYFNRKDLSLALLIGFIYYAILRLLSIPNDISKLFQSNTIEALLFMLIGVCFALVSFWLTLRFLLLPYLFCIEFSRKPFELISESFRRMSGKCGSYIRLAITVSWWRFLVSFAVIIIFGIIAMNVGLLSGNYRTIILLVSLVIGLLVFMVLSPYPILSLTGFANNVIPSVKELRKAEKKKDISN